MNFAAYATIREHLQNVLAQGLQLVAPAELERLTQETSALNLRQSAALLAQLQQQASAGSMTQKDAETLVKVAQLQTQAEIQLSGLSLVDLNTLADVQHGVYIPASDRSSGEPPTLDTLLTISNPFVRGQQIRAYFAQASDDELTLSIERLWCDVACAPAIAEGLRARPEQVLRLVRQALTQINPAIQYTALRVLRTLPPESSHAQAACQMLTETPPEARTPKIKKQFAYLLAETQAYLNGRAANFRQETLRRLSSYSATIKNLTSPHKNVRKFAMQEIAKTNDPAFVEVITPLLHQETESKNIKALLECLAEIGGFEAIPVIQPLLGGEFTAYALETLSRLGDRSALTYIFTQMADKKLPEYAQKALTRSGDFVLYPFVDAVKQITSPTAVKKFFSTLWPVIGSPTLQARLNDAAAHDPALASHPIMAYLQPDRPLAAKIEAVRAAANKAERKALLTSLTTATYIPKHPQSIYPTPDGQGVILFEQITHPRRLSILRAEDWAITREIPLADHVMGAAMSRDGAYVLVSRLEQHGDRNYKLDFWAVGQWEQPAKTLTSTAIVGPCAYTLTFDHRTLLLGGDRMAQVASAETGEILRTLPGHEHTQYMEVKYVDVIPNTPFALSGDWLGKLNVWDTTDWHLVTSLKSDSWKAQWTAISGDGKYLVYAGHIGIKLWATATWTEVAAAKKPTGINSVALSPDGRFVLVGALKKLHILELPTLQPYVVLDNDDYITEIAVMPDGRHFLTENGKKGLKIWHLDLAAL